MLLSCTVNEAPEFIGLDNIEIRDASGKFINVTADAHFKNPNSIGGKLKTKGIKIYVNDVEMATIVSEEFEVPSKADFKIPLMADIPTDSLFSDKSIGGLLGSLFSESLKVRYKGDIKYKVFGFSYTYPIDQTENVKIKL